MALTVSASGKLRLATFRLEITPPLGHSLCGGWILPALACDDPLEAVGLVLLGLDQPVVICALDWLGLANDAHLAWRRALAEAAGTTPDRVAVQCVHQHNAPFVCLTAAALAEAQGDLPAVVDRAFFDDCLRRAAAAVAAATGAARPLTHLAHGEAVVERVASNRRVARDSSGRVTAMRRSSCTDPDLIGLPEGLIDPRLKTVAFFDGDRKVASCHYYATHPMSYYEDGRVTADFCGLARRRRQAEEPECCHLYFTGCAGNIAAGKYNDGTPAARTELTARMHRAMVQSEADLRPRPLHTAVWRSDRISPPPHPALRAEALECALARRAGSALERLRPAFQLGWLRRSGRGDPVPLSALHLDDTRLLHLPGEVFIEYQLAAQAAAPDAFVAVAAYGDMGPMYIPTAAEYPLGGYEVGMAFCGPAIEAELRAAIRRLVA
ncbi:MAG TPA: hypothetical protein VFE31_12830 [Opitutaceae bacterium]|nr:hypothetical protein [Opitutaceae bacterium]